MSVPMVIHNNVIGVLRIYTSEPWDFTLEDVNFVQAVAQIAGMAIENCRYAKRLKGKHSNPQRPAGPPVTQIQKADAL